MDKHPRKKKIVNSEDALQIFEPDNDIGTADKEKKQKVPVSDLEDLKAKQDNELESKQEEDPVF